MWTPVFLFAAALAAGQGHDYTQADVDAGSRYYANYCSGCHGADGNSMAGANLSRGTFRRAVNDDELSRIIDDVSRRGQAVCGDRGGQHNVRVCAAELRLWPTSTLSESNPPARFAWRFGLL